VNLVTGDDAESLLRCGPFVMDGHPVSPIENQTVQRCLTTDWRIKLVGGQKESTKSCKV
jgi:hypothetical protein